MCAASRERQGSYVTLCIVSPGIALKNRLQYRSAYIGDFDRRPGCEFVERRQARCGKSLANRTFSSVPCLRSGPASAGGIAATARKIALSPKFRPVLCYISMKGFV